MRLVVDTNIFVSAALKQVSLPYIALYQASQRGVLLKSVATEAQFFEVMARSYLQPLMAPERAAGGRSMRCSAMTLARWKRRRSRTCASCVVTGKWRPPQRRRRVVSALRRCSQPARSSSGTSLAAQGVPRQK